MILGGRFEFGANHEFHSILLKYIVSDYDRCDNPTVTKQSFKTTKFPSVSLTTQKSVIQNLVLKHNLLFVRS